MRARSWITAFLIAAILFSFAIQDSLAKSEIKARFDLPAESLDKALRDFALQANCNISYVPSAVAGLQAPAIKGEFTVTGVLSMLLTGTRLVAVNVNENTIQVVAKPMPTSESHSSPSSNVVHLAYAGADTPAAPTGSATAQASETGADDKNSRDKRDLEEIVVTGTHIRGVSLASPLTEIGREEIDRSGYTSITDVMLSLPQNFGGGYNPGTIVNNSTVNSRFADNQSGASVPNLRGLGPGSTLVLIDGHRMASGLTGGGADIASIPLDAIDRIEVVTDSASAIYGSDAVAGVINVILKRHYDGAITSLSYGLASQGGATEKRASQLFGTTWNSGEVVTAFEHSSQDTINAASRGFTSSQLEPSWLLPQTESNSVTLSGSQDLFGGTSISVDGLYVSRDADYVLSNPFFFAPFDFPTTLRKYAVTSGLEGQLAGDWHATVFIAAAEDATDDNGAFLTTPATPGTAEQLLGTMRNVEANANGTLAAIPSGPLRLAVGAGYRREYFLDAIGVTGSPLTTSAEGRRNVRYAFGELSVPLVEHSSRAALNYLDLIISGRDEHYSDFGGKTVPKVGLVYAPTPSLKLRATWGKAFRAPNLYDIHQVPQLEVINVPSPTSPVSGTPVLIRAGGDPSLQPETAQAWSVGADYSPANIEGLALSTTAFDIKYANRISQIANPFTALTDPLNQFFVTPSLSAGFAQSVYNSYPANNIFNETGAPFDPGSITAIVDTRLINVASQTARGADLSANYRIGSATSGALLFFNGTYLDLTQQNTPNSPSQTLSGLAFYPPKFRLRTGATWTQNAWALTGTVNYLARETNNQVTPFQNVGSWTTIDSSLRYSPALPGLYGGLSFTVAAINLFNRNPPFVLLPANSSQGFNYDATNTSAMGRFIRLQVSKKW
jgi:iron complex outermembrane recepter protein